MKDVRGYAYDVVKAVLAADADDVVDALARAEAVKAGFAHARVSGDWRGLQAHAEHSEAGGREGNCVRREV